MQSRNKSICKRKQVIIDVQLILTADAQSALEQKLIVQTPNAHMLYAIKDYTSAYSAGVCNIRVIPP